MDDDATKCNTDLHRGTSAEWDAAGCTELTPPPHGRNKAAERADRNRNRPNWNVVWTKPPERVNAEREPKWRQENAAVESATGTVKTRLRRMDRK
jgi:hypothetical protein